MIKTTFSASRISELLAGGTGKTASNYILDLAMQSIGISKDLETPAMRHGLVSQKYAFDSVVKPLDEDALWLDEYIPINDYCGASPDCLMFGSPADIKCQFYIDSYVEQCQKVPTKYYQQVQMQMMATGSDKGRLINYLTKPEVWGSEEWYEYPFPLEMRFKIFEFDKDEEVQERILEEVEKAEPKKQSIIKLLSEAELMDEELFFYEQIGGYAYRKLKDCSNIFNLDKVIRVNDTFYYSVKK